MTVKTYTGTTTERKALARSKRLREAGGGGSALGRTLGNGGGASSTPAAAASAAWAERAGYAREAGHALNADEASLASQAEVAATAQNLAEDSTDWQAIDEKIEAQSRLAENKFLRKDQSDTTPYGLGVGQSLSVGGNAVVGGTLTAGEKVASPALQIGACYSEGPTGVGGIFKTVNGKTYIEADYAYFRIKAFFDTLEIRRYVHSGGNRVASQAGMKCSRVEWYGSNGQVLEQTEENRNNVSKYRCYFKASDGDNTITNDFRLYDLAYCHVTNVTNGSMTSQHYWRLVVGADTITDGPNGVEYGAGDSEEHYIDLAGKPGDVRREVNGELIVMPRMMTGSTSPQAGDDIVQLGHPYDKSRQGAIMERVSGITQGPVYDIFQNIDGYSFEDKSVISYGFNTSTGHAFMHVYGDVFIGDPLESTYIAYDQTEKQLTIKAKINVLSPILDGNGHEVGTVGDVVGLNGIKAAFNGGSTLVNGGLVLTNTLALRNGDNAVTAGITGSAAGNNNIALWLGGPMVDHEESPLVTNYAKSLFRFDGSGYLAGGNIRWNALGDPEFAGTVRAKNLFHNVCVFSEGDGSLGSYLNGRTEGAAPIMQGGTSQEIITTGDADVVYMIPNSSSWGRNRTDGQEDTADNGWFHYWDRTLFLPSPVEYEGKVIEVFITSNGDNNPVTSGANKGMGCEKQIRIMSAAVSNGSLTFFPLAGLISWNPSSGKAQVSTEQEGDNTVLSISPSVGYLRFFAVQARDTNLNVDTCAWVFSTGMGGGITINGNVINNNGANTDWVKNWVMAYLMGAGDADNNYEEPMNIEEPAFVREDELNGYVEADGDTMTGPLWLQNTQLQLGAGNSYIEESSGKLKLHGSTGILLDGNTFLGNGNALKSLQADADLLAYKTVNSGTENGVSVNHWFVGTGAQGVLRSGSPLVRYNGSSAYTILDSGNWSSYVTGFLTQNVADGRYLSLHGNADSATKLQTARTIWGQSFDGTGNVSGNLLGAGGSIDLQYNDEINRYGGTLYLQHRGGSGLTGSGTGSGNTGDIRMCSNGGNVGIGLNNAPSYKLDVNGDIRIATNSKLLFGTKQLYYDSTDGLSINDGSANAPHVFYHTGNFDPTVYTNLINGVSVNGTVITPNSSLIANIDLNSYLSGYVTSSALTTALGDYQPKLSFYNLNTSSYVQTVSTLNLPLSVGNNGNVSLSFTTLDVGLLKINPGTYDVNFKSSTNTAVRYFVFENSDELKHRIGSTDYKIWDESNFTPSNYAELSAISDMATKTWVGQQGFLTSHQSLANYVTLDGAQTISGAKRFTRSIHIGANQSGASPYIYWGDGTYVWIGEDSDDHMTISSYRNGISMVGQVTHNVRPRVEISSGNYTNLALVSDIPTVPAGKFPVISVNSSGEVPAIASGADLDRLQTAGTWYCIDSTTAQSLLHTPYTNGNFRLFVIVNTGTQGESNSWWGEQVIMAGNDNAIYMRGHYGTSWGTWRRLWNFNILNTKDNSAVVDDGSFADLSLPLNISTGHASLDLSGLGYVTEFGTSGDNVTWTKAGTTNNLTVPFATTTMGFKRTYVSGSKIADANTMTLDSVSYGLLANYASTNLWSNMPTGMSWGCVLQLTGGSSDGVLSGQLAWDSNHGVTTGVTRKIYWRSRNSTGWGTDDWHKIAFEDWVSGNYLPLNAGSAHPLTGNIAYQGTGGTNTMISFIDSGLAEGNGIAIGGGGATIIGGGESSAVMASNGITGGNNEKMLIGNDQGVSIFTNLQSGWSYRREFTFDTSGNLSIPAYAKANYVTFRNYNDDNLAGYCGRGMSNGNTILLVGYSGNSVGIGASGSGGDIYVNTSHNVGIGTTSPTYKLDVSGGFRATGDAVLGGYLMMNTAESGIKITKNSIDWVARSNGNSFVEPLLDFSYANNITTVEVGGNLTVGESGYKMSISSNDNAVTFDVEDVGDYVFAYGNSRGNIYAGDGDFTGNVGIGTLANANYKLNVNGTAKVLALESTGNVSIGGGLQISFSNGHAAYGSTGSGTIDHTFNGNVYATVIPSPSDIQMKNVHKYLEPSIRDIAFAPIIDYTWKEGFGGETASHSVGSIAQYWQSVFPQAVHVCPNGMLGMEYGVLGLVSAITAARSCVDNERRIAELELKIDELKSELGNFINNN